MKNIVVTGATKGIGRAIAYTFAAADCNVAFCARNTEEVAAMEADLNSSFGIKALGIATDVSDKAQLLDFAAKTKATFDHIDVLINNAGVFLPGKIQEEEEGALEQQMNTNLYSAYHLTRALLSGMIAKKQGHIFNICSTASITPYINGGSYCISKFALLGFSKVLREELKEHGIRVTSILPGATLTNSWAGVDLPATRFMAAEDVAKVIYNAYTLSDQTVIEELLMRPILGDIT